MIDYKDLCEYPFEELERSGREHPEIPLVLDTETIGHTEESHQILYFSWASNEPGIGSGAGPITTENGFNFFNAVLKSPKQKIFHNVTADLEFIRISEMEIVGRGYCTLLGHALLDEYHPTHALDDLSRDIFHRVRHDYHILEGYKKGIPAHQKNLAVPQSVMHPYAHQDAIDTLDLWNWEVPRLVEQGLWDIYEAGMDAEVYAWYQMEKDGVEFDLVAAEESLEIITPSLDTMEQVIYQSFGREFKITSHKQLGDLLKETVPGFGADPKNDRTKTGWKTDKETLRRFRHDPRVQMVLGYNMLAQCKSKVSKRLEEQSTRLRALYKQVLVTGRSSCSKTPLQQVPKRAIKNPISAEDVGTPELATVCTRAYQSLRKIWTVPEGATLVTFDYDQGEYRAASHYSGSPKLIQLMQDPTADFHMIITELIFPEVVDKALLKVLRDIVKHVSFGLLYGMSAPGIARTIQRLSGKAMSDFTSETSESVMKKYEERVPEMRDLQKKVMYAYKTRGYVTDVFGRRYRTMPYWFKKAQETDDYAIINYLCQGTIANVKRVALARLGKFFMDQRAKGMRSKMIMEIHDEIGFELYSEDAWILRPIHTMMTMFPEFDVPITTGPSVGPNLLETKDMTIEEAMKAIQTGERSRQTA